MSATPFHQKFDPLPGMFSNFTSLLRSLTEDESSAPVPGMDWTAAQVGSHVLTVVKRYLRATERAPSRSRLVALNAEEVAAEQRGPSDVADELDAVMTGLAAVAPSVPLDAQRPFHLGVTVSVSAGWANLIGELLVHGDDIARASGRHWSIDDRLLEGVWRDLMPAASGWMRPEARSLTERYLLSFPFGEVRMRIDAGRVHIDDPADVDTKADYVIGVPNAAAFTLQFPYRRALITDPATALLASRFIDI